MELKFKPKIGQLVSWDTLTNENSNSKIGVITDVLSEYLVEVYFINNNWKVKLNIKYLTLLNEVE